MAWTGEKIVIIDKNVIKNIKYCGFMAYKHHKKGVLRALQGTWAGSNCQKSLESELAFRKILMNLKIILMNIFYSNNFKISAFTEGSLNIKILKNFFIFPMVVFLGREKSWEFPSQKSHFYPIKILGFIAIHIPSRNSAATALCWPCLKEWMIPKQRFPKSIFKN